MGHFEIIEFYLDLVRRAQERGIRCAVTSGMACVAEMIAEARKLTLGLIHPSLAEWLPDMAANYRILIPSLP